MAMRMNFFMVIVLSIINVVVLFPGSIVNIAFPSFSYKKTPRCFETY